MSSQGASTSVGKRSRAEIASVMMRKIRQRLAEPKAFRKARSSKGKRIENGVVGGVVVSGPQGPERKKYDNIINNSPVYSTLPFIASLTNSIAEGAAMTNRQGARITVKSIDCEFNINAGTALSNGPIFLDVFLVWDKNPNGGIPGTGSIFVTTTSNLTFGNLNTLDRFQVLKRERMSFDPAGGYTRTFAWHQSLDVVSRFPDATGSPITNDYYIVALSPNTLASTIYPYISYVARVSFTDD